MDVLVEVLALMLMGLVGGPSSLGSGCRGVGLPV